MGRCCCRAGKRRVRHLDYDGLSAVIQNLATVTGLIGLLLVGTLFSIDAEHTAQADIVLTAATNFGFRREFFPTMMLHPCNGDLDPHKQYTAKDYWDPWRRASTNFDKCNATNIAAGNFFSEEVDLANFTAWVTVNYYDFNPFLLPSKGLAEKGFPCVFNFLFALTLSVFLWISFPGKEATAALIPWFIPIGFTGLLLGHILLVQGIYQFVEAMDVAFSIQYPLYVVTTNEWLKIVKEPLKDYMIKLTLPLLIANSVFASSFEYWAPCVGLGQFVPTPSDVEPDLEKSGSLTE